jgi:hypothetical protein
MVICGCLSFSSPHERYGWSMWRPEQIEAKISEKNGEPRLLMAHDSPSATQHALRRYIEKTFRQTGISVALLMEMRLWEKYFMPR